jgi:valyl-tRNA synthetase
VRTEYSVEPGRRIAAVISAGPRAAFMREQAGALQFLARVDGERLEIVETLAEAPQQALTLVVGGMECYLPLAALVDLDRERARLGGELADLDREIERTEKLLANPGFTGKAPAAVVQKERDKLVEYADRRERLRERLEGLA